MRDPKGYYEILGIGKNFSDADLKRNYRDRAKEWHPDYNNEADALEKFQKISVAYDIIKEDKTRLAYDLLSEVYNERNFPDMFALKAYTNQDGKDDTDIRAINVSTSKKSKQEIYNFKGASSRLLSISLFNWTIGWFLNNPLKNVEALKNNFQNVHNEQENLRLFIHNALAYNDDKKPELAYIFAKEAYSLADNYQKTLLGDFIAKLNTISTKKTPAWDFRKLQWLQLLFPIVAVLAMFASFSRTHMTEAEFKKHFAQQSERNYFHEVRVGRGGRTTDDTVVGRIISIAVDVEDTNLLFHVTSATNVMYGPSDQFDVMTRLPARHTVRITGHTADQIWFRIMLDNGDMGFVRAASVKRGIGNDIPSDSRIFRRPRQD
jgi:curved DNA-binding protein CbpA